MQGVELAAHASAERLVDHLVLLDPVLAGEGRRIETRQAETVEKLLAAATEELRAVGPEAVTVRTVAGRLGHRNAATTLNVYAHFLAETDREAAGLLGQLFDEAVAAGADAKGG